MTAGPPRVARLSWGRIELVDGRSFRDVKLSPGGARAWDWSETGTHHLPGIQVADVAELVDHGAELVILSRGVWKRLRTQQATLDWLAERGIDAELLPTKEAVARYHALLDERRVGALLHSTC